MYIVFREITLKKILVEVCWQGWVRELDIKRTLLVFLMVFCAVFGPSGKMVFLVLSKYLFTRASAALF